MSGAYFQPAWANDKQPAWKDHTQIHKHPVNRKTSFIKFKNKKRLKRIKGKNISDTIAESYGPAFGLNSPAKELKLKKQTRHSDAVTTYRYQQQYNGVPVIGAELVAGMDEQNQMKYISGETTLNLSINTTPSITSEQATGIALSAVSKWYRKSKDSFATGIVELSVFNSNLISPDTKPAVLVWKLEVTAENINEFILVDAMTGAITFHLNQVHEALNRQTYTANNTADYQNQLVCDESDPTCSAGDSDAQKAHEYAEDTYNFYFDNHGRDGIDGSGGAIISSVHVGPDFQNAAWTGTLMIYGDGFPQADDVVAHELTHGVTENESNLFYYYQSGAINESFSDLWGEFVDQSNAGGTDNASVKWLMGEDVPGLGAIRDMENPLAFGDPDKMTSSSYFTGSEDNGGVHINSGVNNKAVYLMTDGGSFNGQTVTGLGITKVAKLYYEVQTKHLTSGSDYLDLYNALIQACSDLVGTGDLASGDCTQVQAALTAVEMNQQPLKGFNPEAEVCPASTTVSSTVFSDDIESGLGNWTRTHDTSLQNIDWIDWLTVAPTAPYATSGTHSLFGQNVDVRSDQFAQISLSLPSTSDKIFLHFKHALDFEAAETNSLNQYYDGAVLEYSVNNGTSWTDAADLIVDGKNYTGVIQSVFSNPLAGRLAFSAISNGFVSTRLNLSGFANSTILFRWRVATDSSVAASGWIIDDVKVVTCQASVNSLPVANAGSDRYTNSGSLIVLNGSSSSDADGAITYSWEQVGGEVVSLSNATTAVPSLTAAGGGGILSFKLTVTDTDGHTDTDIVNVIVNTAPTAFAGSDIEAVEGTSVTLDASSSFDTDGSIINYAWTQISGDPVTLINSNSAQATFVAPDFPSSLLSFSLVVTDNDGITSVADTVDVTIKSSVVTVNSTSSGGGGSCSINTRAEFNPFMFVLLAGLSILHLWRKKTVCS